jgi:hypothetical protein
MTRRALVTMSLLVGSLTVPFAPAKAAGTARIQQRDGSVSTYHNVRISIREQSMWMTSSDRKGILILGKAACGTIGALVRCFPYDATLEQHGERTHIALQSGTVWINPTTTVQRLSHSSTTLPSHGVLMAVRSQRGTYVSLSGTVDDMQR